MARKHARRGHGDGRIGSYQTKSGVRFLIEWREPHEDIPGRTVRRSRGGFYDRKEASNGLLGILAEVSQGRSHPNKPKISVSDLFNQWIDSHRLAKSTAAGYRRNFRLHVEPYIGHLRIDKVTPETLASLYRNLERGGKVTRDNGKPADPIGPNTILKVHNALSAMFRHAVEATPRLLIDNPARSKSAAPPSAREVKEAARMTDVWTVP